MEMEFDNLLQLVLVKRALENELERDPTPVAKEELEKMLSYVQSILDEIRSMAEAIRI